MSARRTPWDDAAIATRAERQRRERKIRELLVAAGWRAGRSVSDAVQRMDAAQRDALIRLLESDVVLGPR